METQAVNGKFTKPTRCFSQIANEILRDASLSLKAKGLYALIVSYITLPNFTLYKGYLKAQCAEGRYSFDSAWKELVSSGYLNHNRIRQKNGTFQYEYALSEKMPLKKDTVIINKEKNVENGTQEHTSTHLPISQEYSCIKHTSPVAKNQSSVTPYSIYNNKLSINNQSVSTTKQREKLAKQIDLEFFTSYGNFPQNEQVIVLTLFETLLSLQVNRSSELENFPDLFLDISSCTILEFLAYIKPKPKQHIRYPIPYWKRTFLNFLLESAFTLGTIGN